MKRIVWAVILSGLFLTAMLLFSSCSGNVSSITASGGTYIVEFTNPTTGDIRLEFDSIVGDTVWFVLKSYSPAFLFDVWKITFKLNFNQDMFEYNLGAAVPNQTAGGLAGLGSNGNCSGCCIQWTDSSCDAVDYALQPPQCIDKKTSWTQLCIKRSCTNSVSCTEPCDNCSIGTCTPGNCSCAECPPRGEFFEDCKNVCAHPLYFEDLAKPAQFRVCCSEMFDKCGGGECQKKDCLSGSACDPGGIPLNDEIIRIPLKVLAARDFDDFNFQFSSTIVRGRASDAPILGINWTAATGTVKLVPN